MSRSIMVAASLAFSLTSVLAITEARSFELNSVAKSCDAKPGCSYLQPDKEGGMLFKVKTESQTKYIRCSRDGECMRIMPRGKKFIIRDITVLLAAE